MSGKDGDYVWKTIERIVCKTIIAILPTMKVEYQAAIPTGKTRLSCFQVRQHIIVYYNASFGHCVVCSSSIYRF
jgi:hypothetical protein